MLSSKFYNGQCVGNGCLYVKDKSVILRFNEQAMAKVLRTLVDGDHGADGSTRKSTTGMVQRLGQHAVNTASNLQTPIGMNVSEAEYYAFVHGSCHS